MSRLSLAAALAAAAFLPIPSAHAEPVCFDTRILVDHSSAYYDGCTQVRQQWDGGYCLESHGTVLGSPYRFVCYE